MPIPRTKPVDWADDVADICNASDYPLFKRVDLHWEKPTEWKKGQSKPTFDTDEPFLYALIRNHWKSTTRDHIEYVGLTKSPRTRFGNHKTAREIVSERGSVMFTYAKLDAIKGRNRLDRVHTALEEIEHLLIWAIGSGLRNEKKQFTLPGMGSNGGNAWHIVNSGYHFAGRMPKEIIYPWMLVRHGRDTSAKRSS
ncbi:MAG: hypothetical protein ACK4MI_07335 [Brevundimonas sp.]|uniref:hypothetical protein n=1 Tax=Brevundimonas sp. TaxID=1871086 RepID=UPI00391918E7